MQENDLMSQYGNMLYKICFFILWNEDDAQDAVQETFYRYYKKRKVFQNSEHEKAWLIRVATNISKDMRRFRLRNPAITLDEIAVDQPSDEEYELYEVFHSLPEKLKIVVYLHYVAGYSQIEISNILKLSYSTINKRMKRAKERLKKLL